MRSTYLDTELMLVIDSRETESADSRNGKCLYQEKSKESAVKWTGKGGTQYEKKDTELAEEIVLRCAASGILAASSAAVAPYAGQKLSQRKKVKI